MSCFVKEETSFARLGRARAPVAPQANFYAVVVFGQAGFGELEFEFSQDVGGGFDGFGVLADLTRHFEEDAMDLGLFVIEQAD